MTQIDTDKLRALVQAATPGDLSTATRHTECETVECPACQGDGELDAADYCNFDSVALGVQFYGIGGQFGAHEALWRYLVQSIPAILAMAEDNERLSILAQANNDLARHEANGRRELQAENARLREALDPFAAIAEWWGDDFCTRNPDHNIYGAHAAGGNQPDIRVTMVDAVAARQALAATGDPS